MIRLIVFAMLAVSVVVFLAPDDAYGCSRGFSIDIFLPYTTYLHGDCTEDIGHLSWTGLIMVMLAVCAGIIIAKRRLRFSRRFYLIMIPAVLICILGYSVAFYGTADLTEFFLPRDYLGNLEHHSIAQQIASRDFAGMLEERNVKFRDENMFVTFNHDEYTREQYRNGEFEMPYNYCGIAIDDNHDEYWYSATYNDKQILESEFHEEIPTECGEKDKTCFCQATRIIRDNFKFRP